MNRRELIEKMMLLPAVKHVNVFDELRPEDVVVIEVDADLTPEDLQRIRDEFKCAWPDGRAIIMNQARLKILRDGDL